MLFAPACGDDAGSDTDAATESGGSTSTTGAGSTTSTTGAETTDAETAATTGTTAQPTSTTEAGESSGSSSGGAADESSSSGGMGFDCDAIPAGPFAPTVQFMPFNGSEDIGFDGMGNLAGKDGGQLLLVDAAGTEVASYADPGQAFGVRFTADGNVLVAHPQTGVISSIAPDGSSTDFATGINGVNGIYPDFDGNVWVTNFSIVGRVAPNGEGEVIVSGADAANANGIVYDPDRGFAFYTNYGAGRILKVEIADDGTPGAVSTVATANDALLDGLAFDVCGNLYAVDNGTPRVWRVFLDENGDAVGEPENIVDGPMENIANAQFGRGGDFDENSLYAAGNPGVVYRIEIGVPGAPIPLP